MSEADDAKIEISNDTGSRVRMVIAHLEVLRASVDWPIPDFERSSILRERQVSMSSLRPELDRFEDSGKANSSELGKRGKTSGRSMVDNDDRDLRTDEKS